MLEAIELPGREPTALQHRPRLVDPHRQSLARLVRGPDDAERGAVADARQRAGVAVGEHSSAVVDQRGAVRAEPTVALDVLVGDAHGLGDRVGGGPSPLDAPCQVRRRSVGSRSSAAAASSIDSPLTVRQRDAHRPGGTERRRARARPSVEIRSQSSATEYTSSITSSWGRRAGRSAGRDRRATRSWAGSARRHAIRRYRAPSEVLGTDHRRIVAVDDGFHAPTHHRPRSRDG